MRRDIFMSQNEFLVEECDGQRDIELTSIFD